MKNSLISITFLCVQVLKMRQLNQSRTLHNFYNYHIAPQQTTTFLLFLFISTAFSCTSTQPQQRGFKHIRRLKALTNAFRRLIMKHAKININVYLLRQLT
ncbi:hypothetical protein ACKWTF_005055 [Chironomus riparius]